MERVRTEIGVRFCDTDMIGHINNTAIAQYAEAGRVTILQATGLPPRTMILVNINLDFVGQMHLGDEVWVETWVSKFGRTSVTLAQEIFANGKVCARTRSVVVAFDYENNRPQPIPDLVRESFERFYFPEAVSAPV